MKIAIASGKGGTGKTTVSVNLARSLASPVLLLDCDVEEPNAHLFLAADKIKEDVVAMPIPQVDESLCDGCGECGMFCEYHAIVSFGTAPLIFPELCHSCGGCARVCPRQAITESGKRIGVVATRRSGNITLIEGRLDVGVAMAPPLIRAVKECLRDQETVIIDAPPGTSCPVIAAIRETDFVLLVTEPTAFGLNDLTLAVDMARKTGIPFGVALNRMGAGDDRVQRYCETESIPLLLSIPDDRKIAENYSRGIPIVDALPQYRPLFESLMEKLKNLSSVKRI